jgi:hypothetical protein
MKAFRHEVPDDQIEKGESAIKTVIPLVRVKSDKPGWVTLWIDKKKPNIFYFQPVLDFSHWGDEMKKTFNYEPSTEQKQFIIRDLFKDKSQFLFLYNDFYNM